MTGHVWWSADGVREAKKIPRVQQGYGDDKLRGTAGNGRCTDTNNGGHGGGEDDDGDDDDDNKQREMKVTNTEQ